MKSFQDFINERVNTLDTLHDPGIRSYMSRHRVTSGSREDFETVRKIIMIALESGPTARRKVSQMLRQLGMIVPEIKPLVNQLGTFTAQSGRDASKLFNPTDIKSDLGGDDKDLDGIPDERDTDIEDEDDDELR